MQLHLEQLDTHSIQSYDNHSIRINHKTYDKSLIITQNKLFTKWPVTQITMLDEANLEILFECNPEIIIIGHNEKTHAPSSIYPLFSNHNVGFECMNIGAACRTFNILLSEKRRIALAIVFNSTIE